MATPMDIYVRITCTSVLLRCFLPLVVPQRALFPSLGFTAALTDMSARRHISPRDMTMMLSHGDAPAGRFRKLLPSFSRARAFVADMVRLHFDF